MNLFFLSAFAGLILYGALCGKGRSKGNIADIIPSVHPIVGYLGFAFFSVSVLFLLYGRWLFPGDSFYDLYIAIATFEFVQVFLGLAFGFTFGDWARYVIHSQLLQREHIRKAHARWGFVLLALLVVGTLLPDLKDRVRNVASFSSPAVSFTLQTRQDPKPTTLMSEALGDLEYHEDPITRQSKAVQVISALPMFIERDREYIKLLYNPDGTSTNYRDYLQLTEQNAVIIDAWFVPVAACMTVLTTGLQDRNILEAHLHDFAEQYRKAMRSVYMSIQKNPPPPLDNHLRHVHASLLNEAKAYGLEAPSMREDGSRWEECTRELPDTNVYYEDLDRTLPYTTIALAAILYVLDKPESAIMELDRWLEHSASTRKWSWHSLFEVRIDSIKLSLYSDLGETRKAQEIRDEIISRLGDTLGIRDIETLHQWQDDCESTHLAERRAVLFLLSNMNNLAYASLELGHGVDRNVMNYAEMIKGAKLRCFGGVEKNVTLMNAAFIHTYARVLLVSAQQMERLNIQDDQAYLGRLQVARRSLERALEFAREAEGSNDALESIIKRDFRLAKDLIKSSG